MIPYEQFDFILEPLMGAVRRCERFLSPEDDWVEDDRRILFEWLQRRFGHLHAFVYEKGPDDYVTTADASPDEVETALYSTGYRRNLVSSRKYRTHHGGGKQWAVGAWVYDPAATPWQHHVYLFPSPDGGTDIYAHRETSVREGGEHLTETDQIHGDPNRRVRRTLDAHDTDYEIRNIHE